MKKLLEMPEWHALIQHQEIMAKMHMRDLFADDPKRFQRFSGEIGQIFVDFSKNRLLKSTLELLFRLADRLKVSEQIEALFSGQSMNFTEGRPALHTALRDLRHQQIIVNQHNIAGDVSATIKKMREFCYLIHNKVWLGCTGLPFTDVVNLGIGGSDLGPAMVCEALTPLANKNIRCHFVSNVDGAHISTTLKQLNPATTLFIISSKSFNTLETLTNAKTAMHWLSSNLDNKDYIAKHIIAVTATSEEAKCMGIPETNIFTIWDWVGGRYSLWSAIGLPIALQLGMDQFERLLAGAFMVDQHFRNTDLTKNIPVILALIGIWYHNFFGAQTHAIFPYDYHMRKLPNYLQQLDMESNGKTTTQTGLPTHYTTGPIIWGAMGCNGQHAFHQLLHQGAWLVPADFIIALQSHYQLPEHQEILFANCLSQTRALMQGKTLEQAISELQQQSLSESLISQLAPHKVTPGNSPTNTILIEKITAETLGALLAIYEHKTFVQGCIWQINSFDQWGVELGKQMVTTILPNLGQQEIKLTHDASTNGLIRYYQKKKSSQFTSPTTVETQQSYDNLEQ